jgi:hypothetical protein
MSISDFNTCGFDSSKTYRYTNGGTDFCGAWHSYSASFDSTSTTCADFSLPFDDCCECLEDVAFPPTCCGWEDCMDYRYNNSLGPGLNITGYSGGGALVVSSNAGVNQYKWKVNSVSAGNYALVWTGSAYKVTFDLSIEYSVWNYLSSSPITCDGSALPTNNWSWIWTETKSYEAICPQSTFTLGLTDQGGDCRGDLICSGDVEDGQTFNLGPAHTSRTAFAIRVVGSLRQSQYRLTRKDSCRSGPTLVVAVSTLLELWIRYGSTLRRPPPRTSRSPEYGDEAVEETRWDTPPLPSRLGGSGRAGRREDRRQGCRGEGCGEGLRVWQKARYTKQSSSIRG